MKTKHPSYREELREYLKQLSRLVERELPPGPSKHGKCRFALVLADGDQVHYASNSHRGMIRALKRAANRIERKRVAESIFPRRAGELEYTK